MTKKTTAAIAAGAIGSAAIAAALLYVGKRKKKTLTATVRAFQEYLPDLLPLPHPSWRSRLWMKKNPWFEAEVLPVLRARVVEMGLSSARQTGEHQDVREV